MKFIRKGVRLDYRCPTCESIKYISRGAIGNLTRHCRGHFCPLHFHESEDWKYFRVNGQKMGSKQAYEERVFTTDESKAANPCG